MGRFLSRNYSVRSSAIRAARRACQLALGPIYEAHEGPDFVLHQLSRLGDAHCFELRGPAANPSDEEKADAAAAWARKRESVFHHLKSGS